MTKVLLLDIDGVLNAHDRHPNGYCGIDPARAALLARVVGATGCRIVVASSWRYLVLSKQMTLEGFRSLLLTHGCPRAVTEAVCDILPADVNVHDLHDRGKLARRWLDGEQGWSVAVALDDGSWPEGHDLGYEACGIPCVRPIPAEGLTERHVVDLIRMLGEKGEEGQCRSSR